MDFSPRKVELVISAQERWDWVILPQDAAGSGWPGGFWGHLGVFKLHVPPGKRASTWSFAFWLLPKRFGHGSQVTGIPIPGGTNWASSWLHHPWAIPKYPGWFSQRASGFGVVLLSLLWGWSCTRGRVWSCKNSAQWQPWGFLRLWILKFWEYPLQILWVDGRMSDFH